MSAIANICFQRKLLFTMTDICKDTTLHINTRCSRNLFYQTEYNTCCYTADYITLHISKTFYPVKQWKTDEIIVTASRVKNNLRHTVFVIEVVYKKWNVPTTCIFYCHSIESSVNYVISCQISKFCSNCIQRTSVFLASFSVKFQ